MSRCAKILSVVLFILVCATFIIKLCSYFWAEFIENPKTTVDIWLEQNNLGKYKQLFKKKGKPIFAQTAKDNYYYSCFSHLSSLCVFGC